ncbi:MAG: IS200/IS605 family transposase [Muribaculaceae bacterium]|nr:IS200/IS605 family transposase [Muribaculaceae bacterium]
MSKVTALYHIVFCTKGRAMTLPIEYIDDLYRFIWRLAEDMDCKLLRIGGIQNHVHILVDLHQTVTLSMLVQNIKGQSSGWMKKDSRFRSFSGWGKEYFACTVSPQNKFSVIEYIKNQPTHHLGTVFDTEIQNLYSLAGQPYTEYDLK